MKWCHLHCHSDFSFLDGVGRSLEYAEIAARHGQPALALTDHGNLYGLPAHWRACEQFGIKPLAGIEWYVNDEREKAKEIKAKKEQVRSGLLDPTFLDAHLVTLALDQTGWKNLLWLNHDSVRNGFYYRPRTTHELICQHAEGLVATTACIGSLFGQYALRGDTEKLRALLGQFRDAFGDRFFYEVHVNEMPEQKKVNAVLRRVAGDMGIRPLLTCDVHYACAGDDARQDEMIATARHQKVDDPKAFKLSTRSLWFMDLKEVWSAAKRFGHDDIDRGFMAEAAANTEEVQDRASVNIFGDGTLRPPPYPIPARAAAVLGRDGRTVDAYAFLRQTCIAGLRERFPGDDGAYRARLNHELSVIRKLNMADFYLVTMDIVRECRRRGVMVWTRGSGCASLAALCCGITAVDPIRFKLLFERFVDPHRPNAPDFDLDIDSSRRYEIIGWLVEKYGGPGGERIARICSIQTFGIKSALRDVLGSRGVEPRVAMRLAEATAAMPTAQGYPVPQAEIDLGECPVAQRQRAVEDAIKSLVEAEPAVEQMVRDHEEHVRAALLMVGRARGRSLHAAGYVVAPGPLREFLPVDRAIDPGTKEPTVVTAWTEGQAAQDISPTGLMKIDMLGLETVAVVSLCAAKVADRTGRTREEVDREIDGLRMDYTDPKTLAEFAGGNGIGLHQLNEMNQALATFVRRVRPRGVDDIIACVAAFRPGSMEHLESYVARARGREAVPKVHPVWDRLTGDTYGIVIYQEQIMNLLHELGGLELRAAYKAMKAISKKLPKDLAKIKQDFTDHATAAAGVAPALADRMFRDVQSFAGYGFNRCASGDTVLFCAGKNPANPTGETTIADAYKAFRSKTDLGKKMRAGRWRVLQMDGDGRVRPGVVKAIYDNGERPVFEVRTASGRSIKVTGNHRLLTNRGYQFVSDITTADYLVCMGVSEPSRTKKGRPNGRPGEPRWVDGKTVYLRAAKVAVARRANGRCEFCGGNLSGRSEFAHVRSIADCGFDVRTYHDPKNLRHACNPCHKRFDYDKGERRPAWSKGRPTELDRVDRVWSHGTTRVYDIEMATAEHNFVANEIVSHNSHATSYGILSWITAYLRAYYPTEFWWAWLCRTENKAPGKGKTERKSEAMMSRARASGIRLLPPLVGRSGSQWRILSSGGLLAPLSLVSTVGEGAADAVRAAWLKERWTDIWGFLAWAECHGRVLNARAISALARAGSLSEWVPLHNAVDIAAVFAECKARKAETRTEMTRRLCTQEAGALMTTRPDFETFAAFERAALGFAFWRDAWNANRRREKVESLLAAGRIVGDGDDGVHGKRRAFKVASVRLHTDKRKKQMAFLGLVSPGGRSVKGVVFASLWREHSASVKPDGVYLVRGEFDRDSYLVNGSDPFIPVDEVRLDARGTS